MSAKALKERRENGNVDKKSENKKLLGKSTDGCKQILREEATKRKKKGKEEEGKKRREKRGGGGPDGKYYDTKEKARRKLIKLMEELRNGRDELWDGGWRGELLFFWEKIATRTTTTMIKIGWKYQPSSQRLAEKEEKKLRRESLKSLPLKFLEKVGDNATLDEKNWHRRRGWRFLNATSNRNVYRVEGCAHPFLMEATARSYPLFSHWKVASRLRRKGILHLGKCGAIGRDSVVEKNKEKKKKRRRTKEERERDGTSLKGREIRSW